jgi:hypothetical protein
VRGGEPTADRNKFAFYQDGADLRRGDSAVDKTGGSPSTLSIVLFLPVSIDWRLTF